MKNMFLKVLTIILISAGIANAGVIVFKGYAVNTRNRPLNIGTPVYVLGYESICSGVVDSSNGHFYCSRTLALATGTYSLKAGTNPYLYSEDSFYYNQAPVWLGTVMFSPY